MELPSGHLPLMEHFYTVQGEGFNTGTAAYFFRLAGCDVGCSWCDVKESWSAEGAPLVSISEMIRYTRSTDSEAVVITGGEPCMYDLTELTAELIEEELDLWLETSGAYPITGDWHWICLSPKRWKACLEENYPKADELKVVIARRQDLEWAEEHATNVGDDCLLYLQPEWDRREEMMPLIIDYIKRNPKWAISLQTHKYMHIP